MDIQQAWQLLNEYLKRFAKQRTDLFNFSLVLYGLITSAIVAVLVGLGTAKEFAEQVCCCVFLVFLGFVLIIISINFKRVDDRTMSFIDRTRSALIEYEDKIIEQSAEVTILPYKIEKEVNEIGGRRLFRFRHLIRNVCNTFIGLGIVACIAGIVCLVFFLVA